MRRRSARAAEGESPGWSRIDAARGRTDKEKRGKWSRGAVEKVQLSIAHAKVGERKRFVRKKAGTKSNARWVCRTTAARRKMPPHMRRNPEEKGRDGWPEPEAPNKAKGGP